jgi:hypothetical protein
LFISPKVKDEQLTLSPISAKTLSMKNLFFLCSFFLIASPLFADYDLENVSCWEIEQAGRQAEYPYRIEVSGDWVGDSKFTKDSVDGDHIRYGYLEAEFQVTAYRQDCFEQGLLLALSYEQSRIDWECNPFFDRRNFNTASLSLLFFTHRFTDWSWVGQLRYNIDADNWDFVDYATYDWLLWGRYAFRPLLGLHAGLYAQTGIHLPQLLPVIGFDYIFRERWKLAAIFPLNLSLQYAIDGFWTLRIAGRWWNDRHRVGKHEHLHKAIWRYTNYGVELGALYDIAWGWQAEFHSGCAFGGRVKVANRRGHNTHTLRFKPAPYFGGEISINF